MHQRLLVLTDKKNAKNSEEARNYVRNFLLENNFAGEGTYFSTPTADWFSIGGRWSGELAKAKLNQEKLVEFDKEFEKKQLGWVNNSDKKEEDQKRRSFDLFKKYFPKFKGVIPIWRDRYEFLGFEDDAMIADEKIWKNLIKDCEEGIEGIIDIDGEFGKKKDVIGKKWVVMVDYHS